MLHFSLLQGNPTFIALLVLEEGCEDELKQYKASSLPLSSERKKRSWGALRDSVLVWFIKTLNLLSYSIVKESCADEFKLYIFSSPPPSFARKKFSTFIIYRDMLERHIQRNKDSYGDCQRS